jgi:hypothetical protein
MRQRRECRQGDQWRRTTLPRLKYKLSNRVPLNRRHRLATPSNIDVNSGWCHAVINHPTVHHADPLAIALLFI